MQKIVLIFLFSFVAILACGVCGKENESPESSSFSVPIQQHFVGKDVLKARQMKRLEKLGKLRGNRVEKSQKLLEVNFLLDYVTANVSFGTPKQDFTVALSSGSTRAWVLSRDYKKSSNTQHSFDPEKSSTYVDLSREFTQQDGSFNVHANFGSDTLTFGKAKIRNQAFGLADQISTDNDDAEFPFDGVFGFNHLGPNAYKSGEEPKSPIDNILKPLVQKVVTVYLGHAKPPSDGPSFGLITFGDIDREHCNEDSHGTIQLNSSLTNDDRFAFSLVGFDFGGEIAESYPGNAYLDSSISTVRLPAAIYQEVIKKIGPSYDWDTGLYTVPCKSSTSLNTLVFQIGPNPDPVTYITIEPENYVIDLGLEDGKCALALELNSGDQYQNEEFLLGTPAFRSYSCYTYDFEENVIRMYYHKN